MSAKLRQVIEVLRTKGRGTQEDPMRTVIEYWSTEGLLLATQPDPYESQGTMEHELDEQGC